MKVHARLRLPSPAPALLSHRFHIPLATEPKEGRRCTLAHSFVVEIRGEGNEHEQPLQHQLEAHCSTSNAEDHTWRLGSKWV